MKCKQEALCSKGNCINTNCEKHPSKKTCGAVTFEDFYGSKYCLEKASAYRTEYCRYAMCEHKECEVHPSRISSSVPVSVHDMTTSEFCLKTK